ncbi:carboxylesterase family protein [Sphingobium tyrosinilyticum]|uniref:Carboxylesterase family protein n=1 Tax=Sphingobium tyrosinilyticum TaxID=2715436 RepID=A0ABV9F6I9_9SPHN
MTDGLNMSSMRATSPRTHSSPFADDKLAVRPLTAYQSGAFARVPVMIGATSADIGGRKGVMIAGARRLAGAITGHGVPVYHYRFSYVAPAQGNPKSGAWHASDIPFFLDNAAIKYGEKTTPRDVEMGHIISGYVVDFAKSGNPNGRELPRWAPFNPKVNDVMDFNQEGKAVQGKDPWAS